MHQAVVPISSIREIADNVFALSFQSQRIAREVKPGQFVNIRVSTHSQPLLRRPFSVSRIDGSDCEIIFNVVGLGTKILSETKSNDELDVLGPLGKPFAVSGDYETAVLIAGGLGVAPFPLLTSFLLKEGKHIETFLGVRSAGSLAPDHLQNVHVATDDGSRGFHGTVVQLFERHEREHRVRRPKLFACGPTRMLMAASESARRMNLPCELSLEGDMGCGIGICQGCPVERVGEGKKYALVCTEGPAFKAGEVILN